MAKYKDAVAVNPGLEDFVVFLQARFDSWVTHVNANPPSSPEHTPWWARMEPFLSRGLQRLSAMLGRTDVRLLQMDSEQSRRRRPHDVSVEQLALTYVGPGELREDGPRHDNDHIDILKIAIAPTDDELMSDLPTYLPYNVPGAPHPYPSTSMNRLLDIQFRLLREELMSVRYYALICSPIPSR